MLLACGLRWNHAEFVSFSRDCERQAKRRKVNRDEKESRVWSADRIDAGGGVKDGRQGNRD
jgi:hypothetical protein